MLFIPFIYFSLLTLYWWGKHQGIDVCVYMSSLYAFTSLMCIVVVLGELTGGGGILFENNEVILSPIATLLYCAFITWHIAILNALQQRTR